MQITVAFYFSVCAANLFTVDFDTDSIPPEMARAFYDACNTQLFAAFRDNDADLETAFEDTFERLASIGLPSCYNVVIDPNIVFNGYEAVDLLLRQDMDEDTVLALTIQKRDYDMFTVCSNEEGSLERFIEKLS